MMQGGHDKWEGHDEGVPFFSHYNFHVWCLANSRTNVLVDYHSTVANKIHKCGEGRNKIGFPDTSHSCGDGHFPWKRFCSPPSGHAFRLIRIDLLVVFSEGFQRSLAAIVYGLDV
ncbi:hypothetical protein GOP47_0005990 [Adiantum capillus-veneris]|uniref:Uncharacterized protein n=1 Tax=Adiantum capillus-veneris TaxID=13818 RepID=A0A9D4V2E2_ADICA|nr:hypothetical protein GOP47_0005990 [Adiantum capillus-veneris]